MGNVVHVIASIVGAGLLACPFWAFWTVSGFGRTHFNFLPEEWQEMGLLDCACLLITLSIMRYVVFQRPASVIPAAVVTGTVNGHAQPTPLWSTQKWRRGNRLGDSRSIFATNQQTSPSGRKDIAPAVAETTYSTTDANAVEYDPRELREFVDLWGKLSVKTRTACLAIARDSVVKHG